MNDADRIEALGGPAKLAVALGYDKANGGVQRVQNWKTRGIPAAVKLAWPELFLVDRHAPPPELISGDGTGQSRPPIPDAAYPPDAQRLETPHAA